MCNISKRFYCVFMAFVTITLDSTGVSFLPFTNTCNWFLNANSSRL